MRETNAFKLSISLERELGSLKLIPAAVSAFSAVICKLASVSLIWVLALITGLFAISNFFRMALRAVSKTSSETIA